MVICTVFSLRYSANKMILNNGVDFMISCMHLKNIMATRNRISTNFLVLILLVLECLGSVFGQNSSGNIRCFERERQALLELKDEVVDENGRLSSWAVGGNQMECCKWIGVQCDNITNHVTQLNLRAPPGFNSDGPSVAPLKGKISSSLLELRHLTYLDLSLNDFGYSNIPEFIGSLEKLQYLNLSFANFHGSIPPSVGNLSELIYLDFSSNSGLFSENLGWVAHLGSLEYLDLSFVELGKASNIWLHAISNLTSIKELHLVNCGLQGILPSSLPSINAPAPLSTLDLSMNPGISSSTFLFFLNFSKSLTSIDFSSNNMTILTPAYALDNQIFLEYLDLSNNNLEGGIPRFFGNMSSLIHLDLSHNSFMVPLSEIMINFSGSVEKNLKYLDLSDNMITGSLPDFSKFSSLNVLVLGGNKLNGSITKDYPNIPSLIHLDLSSNSFTGELPDLTIYPLLEKLYLNNNMFNGPLRESIGSLSKMEVLVLASNNFEGIVTESHLYNLSRLTILDFSSNPLLAVNCSSDWIPPFQLKAIKLSKCKVGPHFPQWLQYQKNLKFLDISFSQITDTIPSWIGDLTSGPINLNMSNNQIHGVFPKIGFFSFNLTGYSRSLVHDSVYGMVLDLSRNKITGQATFLCQSEEWVLIDLSSNLFFGNLPNCFANSTRLRFINLANNNFYGEIPSSFGSLPLLSLLNLRNNNFSGGIPTSLRNCTGLKMIDLGENRLTGIIPTWIGDELLSLIVLSLRFNEFRGIIPSSICNLQNLLVLDLSFNKISGVIPKCLDNLTAMTDRAGSEQKISDLLGTPALYYTLLDAAYFTWKGKAINYVNHNILVELIDLSSNALIGDIPSEITKLLGLNSLNLSRNSLSGQIPVNIGLLKDLDSLDISRNHLSGGIPASLSELSFLGNLDLSYNNLSGRIPPLSFDESTFAGNPGLCGIPVLNKSCPNDNENTHKSDASVTDNLKLDEDELITNGFYICMAFGFVFGFWGIFGVILLNKSARSAYFKLLDSIEDSIYMRQELKKAHLREESPSSLYMINKL
ncbi:receptor-like protein EIX2 [Primulina eburnea]|uniref:receptor-like protein EIX2 n=1 Tax=Primulina eburnea TaxID=1245227 RepID=UPI003C6BECB8